MEMQVNPMTKTKTVRLTPQEIKLFEIIAKGQGVTVSEFMRTASLTIAEMSIDNKELLQSLGKDETQAFQNIKILLSELKDTILNSIKGSNTSIMRKLDYVEKLVDISLYSYLFHTPEIKETLKQQARKSALERKKKILSFINGNPK